MEFDVAFALVKDATYPDPQAFVARAAALGVTLTSAGGDDAQAYEIDGGAQLIIRLVDTPHAEARDLPSGPTSPTEEELALATSHFVIALRNLPPAPRDRDLIVSIIVAALLDLTPAVAAIMPPVATVHRAELFTELVSVGAAHREVAPHLVLGIIAGAEDDNRLGLLTYGMTRYGREELLVTAPLEGAGAVGFIYDLAEWLLSEPAPVVDDGDELTRGDASLTVQRVPHPAGTGPNVIKLDLPR
jgi:hypothetical protein